MNDPALRRWAAAGLLGLVVIIVAVPLSRLRQEPLPSTAAAEARFVGTAACVDCHRSAAEAWAGSDHDLAMDLATEETVLLVNLSGRGDKDMVQVQALLGGTE